MRPSSTLPRSLLEPDPKTDIACSLAWSRAPSTAGSSRKDGRRIAHPLQQSWAAGAVNISEKVGSLPVDVHLYVRGGEWIEQFSNKLVGEAGGNRHLSSIYVSGSLRKRGEAELRAKLEARGWTLPAEWHSEEWVLWQRHGNQIVIKLAYAKSAALEGLSVLLEASLADPDVWWSLPVYVDTGREPVFGTLVDAGIFCPAIAGQEIAVGVANRGSECYAVMPIIDGCNMLKAPYLIWPGDKHRNWEEGGAAFASFPGLQTTFLSTRWERVEATYRPLRFARSKPTADCPSSLTPAQGSVRVRLYNVRKIAFNSDPDEALGQVEDMKGEIAAVVGPTDISPLLLPTESQELCHFDTCVATAGADVRQTFESVDISWEVQSLAGEVAIHYRSLTWFREAHAARQRAGIVRSSSPLPPPRPMTHVVASRAAPPDSIALPSPSKAADPWLPLHSPPATDQASERRRSGERALSTPGSPGSDCARFASPVRGSRGSGGKTAVTASSSPSFPYTPSSRSNSLPISPPSVMTTAGGSGGVRRMRDLSPSQRLLQPSPRQARAAQHQLPTFRDLLRSSTPTETQRPTANKGKVTPVGPNLRTANRMREKMADAARPDDGGLKGAKARGEAGGVGRAAPSIGVTVGRGERARPKRTSPSSSTTSMLSGESGTVWVVPHVREKAFHKDEIEGRAGMRNVANLRRQVKADLAPLFDDWSTAELDVMVGGVVVPPETLLCSLPKGVGSAGNPFVVRALEKVQKALGEVAMEGGRWDGTAPRKTDPKGEQEGGEGGGDVSITCEEEAVASGQVEKIEGRERQTAEMAGGIGEVAQAVVDVGGGGHGAAEVA